MMQQGQGARPVPDSERAGAGADREHVAALARRHQVGGDAVLALLAALARGNGEQAQFSHPDLGGMGQWSSSGAIMIGDMFNTALKARVGALCAEVADLVRKGDLSAPRSREPAQGGGEESTWWPSSCGTPSSSGSQNDMRYAYFPETRRLAVRRGGAVTLYDTGTHRIGGVSQQQSGGQDLSFTSQQGTVRLHDLSEIDQVSAAAPAPPSRAGGEPRAEAARPAGDADGDVFSKIERLHELHSKGVLDAAEFAEKKRELLARI